MKKLKLILLAIPVFLLMVSCGEDFTILAPQSERNVENFYQTQSDFNTAINGAYAGLASNNAYGRNYLLLNEMRSDNTTNGGGSTGLAESLARITLFNELPTAGEVETTWAGAYSAISRVNIILNRIDNANIEAPGFADRVRGEALFIRSLLYYNLAITYGNIPLQLEEVTSTAVEINQVSASEVYTQIASDLATAEGLLPSSYDGDDIGRATSGAAATLLGLVELTAGNDGQAETALRRVVDSQQYDLVPSYSDIWGVSNENNEESIFEIQYKSGGAGTGSGLTEYFSPDLSISGGVGGGNTPQGLTDDVETIYENDDERAATFGTTEGDATYLNKYDAAQSIAFDSDANFVVFRYADVLLMLAEAIGESPEAWDLIDEVRNRAGLTVSAITLGSFEEVLLLERRREFVGENKRWADLKRFGVAEEVMAAFLASDGVTESDVRLLFPIPQRELDSAPGQLEQNPL
ncbi:MAG: RagB/SusD family nutrient uptake outer membrane protein [Balneolaceae bacterium]